MVHAFADCELDEELYELRRGGRVVSIEPRVFDVLLYLVRTRERVVSKIELLDALWPGEAVSESVLPRCIAAARRAIGDDRTRQELIQTVHGRGYRFVAPLAQSGAASREASPSVSVGKGESLFVGRELAMERLRAALAAVRSGRGQVVLVVGEPGIGKTRTALELAPEARRDGLEVLDGRCHEGEGAPAYWPWVQVLRECLGDLTCEELGVGAADLAALVPELRERFPDLPVAAALEGEQTRFRLFDSVARFLRRRAARRPILVTVDDLHWADVDSLLLLQFLASALRDAPLLLLGTYRDVEVRRGHPLGSVLGALAREPHCERIVLRGLEPAEVATLMQAIAGAAPSAELAASVHDMTEGNPFFVHEVVQLLADQGRLVATDLRELSLALPQGVRDAIGRRLDSLSPECNELLRVASAIGREFSTGLLERVATPRGEALLELLGEALAARVLVESSQGVGRYAFAHALTRQTLYEELRVPQRVALHRRIGEALEVSTGDAPDALLSEIAHHLFEAAPGGDVEKAIDYGVRAAQRAYALFAYDESARHYERALEALELAHPVDEARRGEILLALGEAWWAAGERDRFRARFAEAARVGRRLGRVDLLATGAVGLRAHGEMGTPPDAETLALLEEALEATRDGDAALRARVLARLSASAPYAHSMAKREELSREAYALATASGNRTAIFDALAARYWATLGPDRVCERLAVGDEADARGREWGDPRLRILGHEARLGAQLVLGDLAAARCEIDAYDALARELRQPLFLFLASVVRGSDAMNCGRFDESQRHFAEALARGSGTVHYAESLHAGALYWLHAMRGDFAAFADVETLLEELDEREVASGGELQRSGFAHARIAVGDLATARRVFESIAEKGLASIERDEHWLLAMGSLTEVTGTLNDVARAEELYRLITPYAERMVAHDLMRAVMGSVHACLGDLATTLGRYDEGEAHYARALAREEAEGLAPALCNSRAGLARLHWLRGGRGARARAEALLSAAESGARAIGSQRDYRALMQRKLQAKGA